MKTTRCASLAGRIFLSAAVIPALFLMACGNPDRNFVRDASVNNLFEITSSEMAVQRSQNAEVRQFAQRMIDDHTAAGNQLKAITSAPNSGLAQPETALDSRHQKMIDDLTTAQDFDRRYIDQQAQAHDTAINLFNDYAKNGKNDALKRFAADTLPVLQDHAQRLNAVRTSVTTPGTSPLPMPPEPGAPTEGTTVPQGTAPPVQPQTPEGTPVPGTTGTPDGTVPEGTTNPGGTTPSNGTAE